MGGAPGGPGRPPGHGGPPPSGPQWGHNPPPGPHGNPYGRPPQQKRKKSGCGCGCFFLALIILVVVVLGYLQFWDVWDWMYAIFDLGNPPGMSDPFVWD